MTKRTIVSILVIVEVTLKFGFVKRKGGEGQSFNPCYSGSNSKINRLHLN